MTVSALPLDGVRVVEFGHIAAAPFASLLLADLGADVVKIEPPLGDAMRLWPPFVDTSHGSESLNFVSLNRNKHVGRVDLTIPTERQRVLDLCRHADVVVENYRPGTLDKLGLGFDDVAGRHRGLVYCSISGFGRSGPYRERGAFDVIVQAMSGLMSVTGERDRAPVKCGVPVGDFVTALYAAYTIAALLPAVRSGAPSVHVDCSMLDCLLGISALQTSEFWGTNVEPARHGSAHPRNAPYEVFATADRPIAIAAGTPKLWTSLCQVLRRTDLLEDDRFADQRRRVANRALLAAALEDVLQQRPCAEWVVALEAEGIPCGPVNSYPEILADPHVVDGGLLDELDLGDGITTPAFAFPVRISGRTPRPPTPPADGTACCVEDVVAAWEAR